MTHPHDSSACGSNLIALFTLLAGSMNTIIMKMQFDMVAQGTEPCASADGVTTFVCEFHKPWFGVMQVKLGMTLCLVYLIVRKKLLHRAYLETPLPLHDPTHTHKLFMAVPEWPSTRTLVATVVPAALDLVQSILSFVGLLWIPASVYQMSGGSMLIFSAFISVKFMNVHLFMYNYVSLALVALALVLVSIAGSAHPSAEAATASGDAWNTFMGMVFILLSRFLYSVNIALEEYFMTTLHVSPILQAGMEGLWGLVLFVPLVPFLTWTEPGTTAMAKIWHEDFLDTWAKLQHSSALVWLVVVYVLSIATYNVAANWVTKHMSSIVRSIIENGRTLGVWVVGLFLYYVCSPGANKMGEPWTSSSWLQVVGFVLLVVATLAYKRVLRYPCGSFYRDDFAPIH